MYMDRYKTHVPDGVEDCLPAECYIKRNIEGALRRVFIISGYDEIETPTYEFFDVFQSGVGSYMQESMIKFMDAKGRILVLRPDLTVPIARVAATKLGDDETPSRLFYIQNSFATASPAFGKAGEFTQAGIELIGEGSSYADAEVIALAVKALLASGLKSFTIDIGQVAYFKALIRGCGLSDMQVDALRHAVDSKDSAAIDMAASELGLNDTLIAQIKALPDLFGGRDVFDRALALSDNEDCVRAVENLRCVYDLLSEYGMADYISIDFGMLHDIAYYSGIIFRGITPKIGFAVVSGGRYDKLLGKFGKALPATGFALGIKRVMIAMERQGLLSGYYDTYAIVSCAQGGCVAAYEYAESLRRNGKRTVYAAGLDRKQLLQMKADKGADVAVYFNTDGSKDEI